MERDPNRIDAVLEAIRKVWSDYPDMRLGQLLVSALAPEDPRQEMYNVEDTTLVRKLITLAERLRKSNNTIT